MWFKALGAIALTATVVALVMFFVVRGTSEVANLVETCAQQHQVEDATDWLTSITEDFPMLDNPNEKCIIKCVLISNNVMDRDGLWTPKLYESVTPQQEHVVRKCAIQTLNRDRCEQAYAFYKCISEQQVAVLDVLPSTQHNTTLTSQLSDRRN